MNLGEVIAALKKEPTRMFYREGWNGRGQSVSLQTPDQESMMTLPYLYIETVQGDMVPWVASQTDMLAEDWIERECKEEQE